MLDELERGDWSAAVFTGKPFVFCVGADIDEFTKLGSADAALEGIARRARAVRAHPRAAVPDRRRDQRRRARRRARARAALHCAHARVERAPHRLPRGRALDHPRAGAARSSLPKLIGPEAAAKVIVLNPLRQNKLLTAPEAFELGIADRLLDPVEFVDESLAVRARALAALERAEPDWSELETVVRKARSRVDDAVHGATRAPYVALDLIAGAKDWPIEEGYAAEEDAMAELLVSPQAQASAYAFTVVERRSKKPPSLPDAKPRRVQKVGIVGAGLMATQLATLFLPPARGAGRPARHRPGARRRGARRRSARTSASASRSSRRSSTAAPAGSSSPAATSCSKRSSRSST